MLILALLPTCLLQKTVLDCAVAIGGQMNKKIFVIVFLLLGVACSKSSQSQNNCPGPQPCQDTPPEAAPRHSLPEESGVLYSDQVNGGEDESYLFQDIPFKKYHCTFSYTPLNSDQETEGTGDFVISREFDFLNYFMGDTAGELYYPLSLTLNEEENQEVVLEKMSIVDESDDELLAVEFYEYEDSRNRQIEEGYELEIDFTDVENRGYIKKYKVIQSNGHAVQTEEHVTYLRFCQKISSRFNHE